MIWRAGRVQDLVKVVKSRRKDVVGATCQPDNDAEAGGAHYCAASARTLIKSKHAGTCLPSILGIIVYPPLLKTMKRRTSIPNQFGYSFWSEQDGHGLRSERMMVCLPRTHSRRFLIR